MNMYNFRIAGLLLIIILSVTACTSPEEKLSKQEAMEFANEVEKSIARGDAEFLNKGFSEKEFTKRLNLPDGADAKGYAAGILKKLALGSQLTTQLSDKDAFSFIKHYEQEGRHHLIFRVYSDANNSLNYHDYELLKTGGKCKIADVYLYLSGETLAETLGALYNTFDKHTSENNKKMSDEELPEVNDLKRAKELYLKGNYTGAKEVFEQLPAYLRNTKAALLMNTQICAGLGEKEYAAGIEEYRKRYPGAKNINLLMIDGYYMQKDFTKMLGAINSLDSQINKDPFLDYYRYLSYNLLQDDANAEKSLRLLTASMPDFQKGYLELIATSLQSGDKKAVDSLSAIYKRKEKFDKAELERIISLYQ